MPKLLNLVRVSFVGLLCLASVSAQQVLRWGADPSGGAPYVYNDPNHPDRYIGYEKEMVDAMAAAMGRKPEFVPSDWETLVSALQRGSRQTPDSFAPVERRGSHIIGNTARLLSGANRSLQFNLSVVPKVPFPQDLFERAIANDPGDGRVDVRLQLLVAFWQPDVISAPRKRLARGFEFRI